MLNENLKWDKNKFSGHLTKTDLYKKKIIRAPNIKTGTPSAGMYENFNRKPASVVK